MDSKSCGCQCGQLVYRKRGRPGWLNETWYINNAHYRRAKQPRRRRYVRNARRIEA